MLFFSPAANISYSDFCVNEMWPKGAELHPAEASGGPGLRGGVCSYVLVCHGRHMEE